MADTTGVRCSLRIAGPEFHPAVPEGTRIFCEYPPFEFGEYVAYELDVAEARERVVEAAREYASTGRGRSERLRTVLMRRVAALDALEGRAT